MDSIYIRFVDYKAGALTANGNYDSNVAPLQDTLDTKINQFFKVTSFNCDVEQTLNIGSQTTGAGAGKITFNPFSIKRTADALSTILFQNAASGTAFKTVEVISINSLNFITFRYTYKLVAVKTISWSSEADAGLEETITFEYGGLILSINQQAPDGKLGKSFLGGWNRLKNIKDVDLAAVIS